MRSRPYGKGGGKCRVIGGSSVLNPVGGKVTCISLWNIQLENLVSRYCDPPATGDKGFFLQASTEVSGPTRSAGNSVPGVVSALCVQEAHG